MLIVICAASAIVWAHLHVCRCFSPGQRNDKGTLVAQSGWWILLSIAALMCHMRPKCRQEGVRHVKAFARWRRDVLEILEAFRYNLERKMRKVRWRIFLTASCRLCFN